MEPLEDGGTLMRLTHKALITLAFSLLIPALAQAEEGWICYAKGSWEECNTEQGFEDCQSHIFESMGLHPERNNATTNAVLICSNHLTQMTLIGNDPSGDFDKPNTQFSRPKEACAMTRCEQGDITGWQQHDQTGSTGPAQNSGSKSSSSDGDSRTASTDIPECQPIIDFTCNLCGAANTMCQTMKNEPTTAAECAAAWAELGPAVDFLKSDNEAAQVFCSALD